LCSVASDDMRTCKSMPWHFDPRENIAGQRPFFSITFMIFMAELWRSSASLQISKWRETNSWTMVDHGGPCRPWDPRRPTIPTQVATNFETFDGGGSGPRGHIPQGSTFFDDPHWTLYIPR
jgi:hypothetical protein